MSAEEGQDVELRELVAQTLENNGVLPKIRAELRASVFLALEDQDGATISPFINKPLKDFVSSVEGTLVMSLVRELLEYFDLDNTLSVFDPETKHGKDYTYSNRSRLMKDLKLDSVNGHMGPLLSHILHLARTAAAAGDNAHKKPNIVETNHSVETNRSIETNRYDETNHFIENEIAKTEATKTLTKPVAGSPTERRTNGVAKSAEGTAGGGGSSLLGDLPPLLGAAKASVPVEGKGEEMHMLERDMLNLGLDSLDNNYEEDFNSSASGSPRDQPSKASRGSTIEEEGASTIDEVISNKSAADDGVTVDITLSNMSGQGDHMEDL